MDTEITQRAEDTRSDDHRSSEITQRAEDTRSDDHRSSESATPLRSANSIDNNIQIIAVRPKERTIGQKCYFAFFNVLLMLTVALNCLSLVLFFIAQIETKPRPPVTNEYLFRKCMLFVTDGSGDLSEGAWSCDFVLGTKLFVLLLTIVVFIAYLILAIRGSNKM